MFCFVFVFVFCFICFCFFTGVEYNRSVIPTPKPGGPAGFHKDNIADIPF